jgi:hypothetical protein
VSYGLTAFVPFPQSFFRDLSHGVMQGANIAFREAIGFVVARGHYILVDPVLGTMSFHSGTLESGPPHRR